MLESIGVSILVLECIPSNLAKLITKKLKIPTIGIGAGKDCDGQVLVSYDMLGITLGRQPRFVRNFLSSESSISSAIKAFVSEGYEEIQRNKKKYEEIRSNARKYEEI